MNETLIPVDTKMVIDICEKFVKKVMDEEQQKTVNDIACWRLQISKMGKIRKFLNFGWTVPKTDGEIYDRCLRNNINSLSEEYFERYRRNCQKQLASSLNLASKHASGQVIYIALSNFNSLMKFKYEVDSDRTVFHVDVGNMPIKMAEERIMEIRQQAIDKGIAIVAGEQK